VLAGAASNRRRRNGGDAVVNNIRRLLDLLGDPVRGSLFVVVGLPNS
jgi:hypothetical protein